MPGALGYIPPTDSWRSGMTPAVLTEKTERSKLYVNALRYYRGEHDPQLTFDPDTEPDDNVTINLVRTAADRTASFLFPNFPQFETDPEAVDETEEENFIKKLLEANGGLPFLIKLATRGFLAGHNFVRVKPPSKPGGYPKLILLDPLSVTVWWKADDQGEILWYEFRYAVGDEIWIQDFVADPENDRWKIFTYRQKERTNDKDKAQLPVNDQLIGVAGPHGKGYGPERFLNSLFDTNTVFELVPAGSRQDNGDGTFTEIGSGEDFAVHGSNIPPIIEWGHLPDPDNYYGQSEATNLNLQDTINRIWSEINRIVREHSDPLDIVTGADVEDVIPYGDNLLTIAQRDAKAQRLEFKGDLSAAVETVNKLVETFLSIVRVVILKGEAKDLQRVTNASVRTLFVDMLAKNAQLQSAYGGALVKIAKLAMQMSGRPFAATAEDLEIKLLWGSPLPVDLTEIANINALALAGGYRSKRTAATELGDDWVQEKAEIEKETDEALVRQQQQLELHSKFAPPEAPGATEDKPPDGGGQKPGTNPKAGQKPAPKT